jgi:hypothetical protein
MMNFSSSPFCFSASMDSLGNSRTIFPSLKELIFTSNPKFSGSISILSTVPPLMVYFTSNVPLFPASTGMVVSIISDSGVYSNDFYETLI